MHKDSFVIHFRASIREALLRIDNNHHGFVLLTDDSDRVIGVVTDGDIRRRLLENISIDDPIEVCSNPHFVYANPSTPSEQLLKQLDHKIKFVPVLDDQKKLVRIITKQSLPEKEELKVFSRAKAPVRISFGGGGSDVSPYFTEHGGAVINATVSIFSHSVLRIREDQKIFIHSLDLREVAEFDNLSLFLNYKGRFGLIQSVVRVINPKFGFELYLNSDFPMSSGLGGSAVVAASILGCFNQFRKDKWDQYELAELAFQAERFYLGVSGGWQDQYATVFGGLNFMEFNKDQNVIHPIRLNKEILLELEESLVLCNTLTTHDSGNIHDDQKEQTKKGDVKRMIQENVELTYTMRNHLLRGRLNEFGQCLDMAWELKRMFSSKITNPKLDEIYEKAKTNGVLGGKLLGAGGGGFFLFYVPPFKKHSILEWMNREGLVYTPFKFEDTGLQSWLVRDIE
ncbi:MAG: CBS domain-containing protein [Bacteroidetes bacterium]|nr:CBS domain-containing protein [Bacteroidota bacterium]